MSSIASLLRPTRFFQRERTIAAPGFNRWMVPPAALAIHLCIGMIYGFSVFWLHCSAPSRHRAESLPVDLGLLRSLIATDCDWDNKRGWTFSLAIVFLGSSAAVFGHWLETAAHARPTGIRLLLVRRPAYFGVWGLLPQIYLLGSALA